MHRGTTATRERALTVGEVASLAGVSVRTLHHYDAIGLLSPAARSDAGYRLYGEGDLARLHQILAYRELGFELDAIAQLLTEPADEVEHLRRQEALLNARLERLLAMRRDVRKQMEARKMGIELDPKEMLEVFGDHDPTQHAEEAKERWGDTDAYRQSQARTKRYTKDDWLRIQQEGEEVESRLAELMRQGVPATDARALEAAEAHRQLISRNFYDCGYDIHRGLAQMYLADPRFTRYYEQRAEGLARYVSEAIIANADERAPQG